MIDNFKLTILSGGFHRCTPHWNKSRIQSEHYYKIYVPTQGSAKIGTADKEFTLVPSFFYFISGNRIQFQRCPRFMDVHWIHFSTESIYLSYLLDQTPAVQCWPLSKTGWGLEDCRNFSRRFPVYEGKNIPPNPDTPLSSLCRIQGLLLLIISKILSHVEKSTLEEFHPQYHQLKPALDFMQNHFRENPPLKEIAGKVHLSPEYFHRQFTQLFKTTPFNFMLLQRLNHARQLLTSTSLSIKHIADYVGYENPLYFTRVFTSEFKLSPSQYRVNHGEFSSQKNNPIKHSKSVLLSTLKNNSLIFKRDP